MESKQNQQPADSHSSDGGADAFAAVALIALFVVTVTFWVAGQ